MRQPIGYAVAEFNQVSHQPSLLDGSFTTDREWAERVADDEQERTNSIGRRESYAVVECFEVD